MEKKILIDVISETLPENIRLQYLIDIFINSAKVADISNEDGTEAVSIGDNFIEYASRLKIFKSEGGVGSVTQFLLNEMPQEEALAQLSKELENQEWHLADAVQLLSNLVANKHFDQRDNLVSICLKETFKYGQGSEIKFKLSAYRNLYGNLTLDIDMHVLSIYNLNGNFRENVCDDGRYCVYIIKN